MDQRQFEEHNAEMRRHQDAMLGNERHFQNTTYHNYKGYFMECRWELGLYTGHIYNSNIEIYRPDGSMMEQVRTLDYAFRIIDAEINGSAL